MTFLHVFHHSVLPWSWWWGVKIAPGEWRWPLGEGQVLGTRGLTLLTLLSTHRRNGLFPRHDKLLSARHHVPVLWIVCPWACGSALPLVEKAHDSHPAGEDPEPDPQSSPRHSGLDPTFIQSASPLPPALPTHCSVPLPSSPLSLCPLTHAF